MHIHTVIMYTWYTYHGLPLGMFDIGVGGAGLMFSRQDYQASWLKSGALGMMLLKDGM